MKPPKTKIIVKTWYGDGEQKVVIEHSGGDLTAEEMLRSFVNSMIAQDYARKCIEDAILILANEITANETS